MSLAALITVVRPRLELPRTPPLLSGVSAVQQTEDEAEAVCRPRSGTVGLTGMRRREEEAAGGGGG